VPDYDSTGWNEKEWRVRFPDWAIGAPEWRDQPDVSAWDNHLNWLPDLRTRDLPATPLSCPRLFVSHRSIDRDLALRVAWIAKSEGFDFWLDVLDPALNHPRLAALNQAQRALATAAIIEMGLLNCSHVIALITQLTKGSDWVPYEYGRVKDVPPVSVQAACWRHPQMTHSSLAEYLLLGPIHDSETAIRAWVVSQLIAWSSAHRKCTAGAAKRWEYPVPSPLPR